MNYAQLVDLIQEYCETREAAFVANIPQFVRQAEQRVYRSVMIPELRKVATTNLSAGVAYVARPADFLSVFSFAVVDEFGRYYFLYDKDPSFIREAYPSSGVTGRPQVYAQFNGDPGGGASAGNFILGPTPDRDFVVELQYYHDPQSIATLGTSWLGDNAEPVLLYGSLVEAYTFLKGEADVMAMYRQRYDEALSQLAGVDVRSSRDDYRDGRVGAGGRR